MSQELTKKKKANNYCNASTKKNYNLRYACTQLKSNYGNIYQ